MSRVTLARCHHPNCGDIFEAERVDGTLHRDMWDHWLDRHQDEIESSDDVACMDLAFELPPHLWPHRVATIVVVAQR
jgi:hypothetical protein